MSGPQSPGVRERIASPAARELTLLVVVSMIGFAVAARFDLFERFSAWLRQRAGLDVDVLAMVITGISILAAAYAWRRYLELRSRTRQLDLIRRDLAVTDEHYRSLFDFNPSAVFSVDLEGRIVAANPAGVRLTGRSVPELLELGFQDLVAPEDLEECLVAFAETLDRKIRHVQVSILTGSGERVQIETLGLPIVVDDAVVGVYCIAADLSSRKRLERDLMRAQVEAERASSAKDLLLANVSHEVRTPLTGLLGNLELLHDTDLDPAQARFVATMERSGDRLLGLVNEILDYTRLEAGKVVLAAVPFDLCLVLSDVTALVGQSVENKGLYFKRKIDPDLPEQLVGDPARLSQILTILLDNAAKFTDDGWVRLAVTLVRRESGHATIRFEVSDSGIGMPTRHRDQLFEAFSQADPSMTRRHGGTGLGLTRCHQLVTMMGGSITVDSTPGFGSAFTFTVTLDEAGEELGGRRAGRRESHVTRPSTR